MRVLIHRIFNSLSELISAEHFTKHSSDNPGEAALLPQHLSTPLDKTIIVKHLK